MPPRQKKKAFGLVNGLTQPTSKELSTSSRKGYVMGNLLRKFQEVGIIPRDIKKQEF